MSIRSTAWVLHESAAKGNDRMVLFVIADEADDAGMNAYPSMERIARHANIDRSTAMRCVARLEADGELLVRRPDKHGRGRFNRYVVVMGRDPAALAATLGWDTPHSATITDLVDKAPDGPVNGADRWQNSTEMVAPGATRPERPIDTEVATQSTSGKPRRRGLDPAPPSPLDAVAAAQRRRYAEQAEREAGRACTMCDNNGVRPTPAGYVRCEHDARVAVAVNGG